MIQTPQDEGAAAVPFDLWPAQRDALRLMETEQRLVILKARQLGITWLVCGFALSLDCQHAGRTVLVFSQTQLEADDIIRRARFLYMNHQRYAELPRLAKDNTQELVFDNGSSIRALPATKKAGRSFTASLVIFDEFAFMLYARELYAAAKPTIDDGGKMIMLSSADALGSTYHQFWQAAQAGTNGFTPVFLPWTARPTRGPDWRDQKVIEALGDESEVLREYPANDIEAFTHAAGLVYGGWSDGPEDGNVSVLAEFESGAGPVYWSVDDGYAGHYDRKTGTFTADSHPRAFLLAQQKPNGVICIFAEHYAVERLSDAHIREVEELGYPSPEYVSLGPGFAELRGRLNTAGYYTHRVQSDVEEGIKEMRNWIAPDSNGVRRVLVHPRCTHLRKEMALYRRGQDGKPLKQYDHGTDSIRYLIWTRRYE